MNGLPVPLVRLVTVNTGDLVGDSLVCILMSAFHLGEYCASRKLLRKSKVLRLNFSPISYSLHFEIGHLFSHNKNYYYAY